MVSPPTSTHNSVLDNLKNSLTKLEGNISDLKKPGNGIDDATKEALLEKYTKEKADLQKSIDAVKNHISGTKNLLDTDKNNANRLGKDGETGKNLSAVTPNNPSNPGGQSQGSPPAAPSAPQGGTPSTPSGGGSGAGGSPSSGSPFGQGKPNSKYSMPSSSLEKMIKNYDPHAENGDSSRDGKPGHKNPINPNDVIKKPLGYHFLTKSQLEELHNNACDKWGITDPDVRHKINTLMTFIADNESSDNSDAVNDDDSNAIGAIAEDGKHEGDSRNAYQEVPGTFATNHVDGDSYDIYDPRAAADSTLGYLLTHYIDAQGGGIDNFIAERTPVYHGY